MFKDAILDALWPESMFDILHQRAAIPAADLAASCVSEEICANLKGVFEREGISHVAGRRDRVSSAAEK
ncbi:MAG: hypothetical protein ACRECC_09945 [Pseudolabrys sp.]